MTICVASTGSPIAAQIAPLAGQQLETGGTGQCELAPFGCGPVQHDCRNRLCDQQRRGQCQHDLAQQAARQQPRHAVSPRATRVTSAPKR